MAGPYVCNTLHTPNADATVGLEVGKPKWTAFNEGIDYKDITAGTRYKKNDIVLFGAGLRMPCNTYHAKVNCLQQIVQSGILLYRDSNTKMNGITTSVTKR